MKKNKSCIINIVLWSIFPLFFGLDKFTCHQTHRENFKWKIFPLQLYWQWRWASFTPSDRNEDQNVLLVVLIAFEIIHQDTRKTVEISQKWRPLNGCYCCSVVIIVTIIIVIIVIIVVIIFLFFTCAVTPWHAYISVSFYFSKFLCIYIIVVGIINIIRDI